MNKVFSIEEINYIYMASQLYASNYKDSKIQTDEKSKRYYEHLYKGQTFEEIQQKHLIIVQQLNVLIAQEKDRLRQENLDNLNKKEAEEFLKKQAEIEHEKESNEKALEKLDNLKKKELNIPLKDNK